MPIPDVTDLTRELIRLNTVNPPGNEESAAKLCGAWLAKNGFEVEYIPYEENRLHLVARNKSGKGERPLVFSGHFDTVPFAVENWTVSPLGGDIKDGKIYGRGSSDMKGGLAAMMVAAIRAVRQKPDADVCLVFTAGEETGCQGAEHLVATYKEFAGAKGIVVAEPTGNIPAIGHKGALYLNITATGKTAHSSMPHLGDNAIYKVARAILKAESFDFEEERHPLLGLSTLNVGKMQGGANLNSVPDYALFTIDARTTPHTRHGDLLQRLTLALGTEVAIETLVDMEAVSTNETDPFVQLVYRACGITGQAAGYPKSLPYLTDGAVLQPAFNGAPLVILGPGEPEMAHKTDEFCCLDKLANAVEIYTKIILKGDSLQ
ncbi:M20 family metallopeptidase [Maribellus sp. CM-23]|uniref:M20 family metallopeptidase n=1 Tax=Maribellus sp. CM-23 TaxID=2781026 RepID=UPI001F3E6ADD|nr:M20 family metallopeptidase [Maribellus sp. CM-23]MCE4562767.1 M20 family metallopeptidase [Maribellus sp. CM-23]